MKFSPKLLSIATVCLCVVPLTHAVEKKISESELPHAVRQVAQELSKNAIVRAYTRDEENGLTEYEVEMTVGGHSKDVTVGGDGSVLEVEEQTEMSALPSAVRLGLKAKAGRGSITRIETITKHGEIVAYEAQITTGSKRSELQVGPDGIPLVRRE